MPHKKGATGIRSRTRTRAAGRAASRPRIKGCTARPNTRQASRRSAQLDENSVLSLQSDPDRPAAAPAAREALAFPTYSFAAAGASGALWAALSRSSTVADAEEDVEKNAEEDAEEDAQRKYFCAADPNSASASDGRKLRSRKENGSGTHSAGLRNRSAHDSARCSGSARRSS